MTWFERILGPATLWRRRLGSPTSALICTLLLSAILASFSPQSTIALRQFPRSILSPAQTLLMQIGKKSSEIAARFTDQSNTSADLQTQRAEIESLQAEKQALEDVLRVALSRESMTTSDVASASNTAAPLLLADVIEARVLGQQARAWLDPSDMLTLPATTRVTPGALTLRDPILVDPVVMLDAGRDLGLSNNQRVLAGGHVWGRLEQVGPRTATVRRVTNAGYRDLVRLGQSVGSRVRFGPRGVLEGTGESLCKVRLVKITEAVSEGDLVYTASEEGLTPLPLLYGHVVRVERKAGANHWEIWMQPSAFHGADDSTPARLSIVRGVLNPERLARQPTIEE